VALLRARVAVCRQLDLTRVLDLAEEALRAALDCGDEESYASVLSHAAFAGYRRGDVRAAQDYAERAATTTFSSAAAHYDAVRAQMFCATSLGQLEEALNYAIKARAMARDQNRLGDVANESNNLAEAYLELGYPVEAHACATAAIEIGRQAGHRSVEGFGHVLAAMATAERGDIDGALEMLGSAGAFAANRIFLVDASVAHAFWLLERGAAGDASLAREIAESAVESATGAGVSNRLTALYSNIARALSREGRTVAARAALESARKAGDRGEHAAQAVLTLAAAEVLPVSAPKRKVALQNTRARILRVASRREDPHAYCTRVRVHRRILELSGGVPDDLPHTDE
jgi:tetratricopeptide (TPR) repeat protein